MTRKLQDYITESEAWISAPAVGDDFAINIREECLVESHIVDLVEDGVVLAADDKMMQILESYGMLENDSRESVARAITHRILNQRLDLLSKYGPDKVSDAIDDVAAFVGSVEEIGSSDISGWVRQVERTLSSGIDEQGVAEGEKEKTPGIALSKAYKKDFDDKKPDHDREETALTGAYSKTGKPGGALEKQGVAEGFGGARYKIKVIGKDKNGDYYVSPNTGKKVYKKANRGDHESPSGILMAKIKEQDVAEAAADTTQRFKVTYTLKNGETKHKIMVGRDQASVAKQFEFKYRHKPSSVKQMASTQEDVAKGVESAADPYTVLGHLTDAYRDIMKSDAYSPTGKETIHRIHGMLSDSLKNDDLEEFSKRYDELGAKYPDHLDELMTGAFESAGIDPDSGTIDEFMAACQTDKQGVEESSQELRRLQELAGMPMATMPPAAMPAVSEAGVKNWIDDLYYLFNETYAVPADLEDDEYLEAVEEFLRDEGVDPSKIEDIGELFIDRRDQDEDADHDYANQLDAEQYDDENTMEDIADEAKYQGREVPLGKPMAGDVKKSKVYVKGPKGNVVKVNFGDKKMRIKKSNPKRRKSFRARHNCANPGPRWKARYWSCRAW